MNLKKILAGAAASAMALTTLATAASAAELAVDNSKIYFADIEGNGALRIEIYNEYGDTKNDSPIDRDQVANATEINVTFTITGVPEGEFEAVVKFADGSWAANSMADDFTPPTITINGDGTYTVKSGFPAWQDEETGGETPAIANGVTVFCVDIAGLAEAANAGKGSDAYAALGNDATAADKQAVAEAAGISVTDVSVELVIDESAGDDGNTDDGNSDDGNTDDGNTDDGNTDDGNKDDGTTTAATTTTSGTSSSGGPSCNCSTSASIVVGGVLALAVVAIIFFKKIV